MRSLPASLPAATALALGLLASCASVPGPEGQFTPLSDSDPIGRIYDYVRSNRDGSRPERIVIFRRSATEIEVYKSVRLCRNAAYVSATFDPAAVEPLRLVAGRVAKDGTQEAFGEVQLDPGTRRVTVRLDLPSGPQIDTIVASQRPWHLYDFDLASLTVATPHLRRPRDGFSFGMALVWLQGDRLLTWRGRADARFVGEEARGGTPTLRYDVHGEAFGERGGPLWIHAKDGHIVGAEFGLPNHAEYRDFKMTLQRVSDGGAQEWSRMLRAHHAGCPTAASG